MPGQALDAGQPAGHAVGHERVPRLAGGDLERARRRASTPRVAMRTTVPGKPSSATTTFEPPASTSSGSPRGVRGRTAATTSSSSVRGLDVARRRGRRGAASSARCRRHGGTSGQGSRRAARRRHAAGCARPPAAAAPPARPRGRRAARASWSLLAGGWLWLRDSRLVAVDQVTVTGVSGPEAPRVRAALEGAARDMTTLHVRDGPAADRGRALPGGRGRRRARRLPARPADRRPRARRRRPRWPPAAERVPVAADGTLLRGSSTERPAASPSRRRRPAGRRSPTARAGRSWRCSPPRPPRAARPGQPRLRGAPGLTGRSRRPGRCTSAAPSGCAAKWTAAARVLADRSSAGATYLDVRLPERAAAGGLVATRRRRAAGDRAAGRPQPAEPGTTAGDADP